MANRFWVGGTGTWDASDTTHWSATSGGAGGASVPGVADTVTLNGSSGGGTVTVNTTVSVLWINMDAFAGTLDFATNNNNVNLSVLENAAFSAAGSATQTLNMGSGTWTVSTTVSATAIIWSTAGSGLTLNAGTSTINFTGVGGSIRRFQLSGRTYNAITFSGAGVYDQNGSGTPTISTLTLGAGAVVAFVGAQTANITTIASTATLSAPAMLRSTVITAVTTIGGNGTYSFANVALRDMAFSGVNSRTASDSFNLGNNSGITINPPSSSSGSAVARVIGA